MCRLAKKKKKKKKQEKKKTKEKQRKKNKKRTNSQKSLGKNPEAVKWISSKRAIVYCRCTCHRHTLVLVFGKHGPIGAREIDGLPKPPWQSC